MKPIEEFETQDNLDIAVKWWQEKLFLTGWVISASVCERREFESGDDLCGENVFDMVNKSCVIRILRKEEYGDRIIKYCAERILVHEMLHLKYNWLGAPDTLEGNYFDVMEHSLLEEMAKTLIMVKYGLDFDYFKEV